MAKQNERSTSVLAEDAIEPQRVPKHQVHTGAYIPAVGMGTFGSDHVPADVVGEAVRGAAEVGYRHFDCAAVYGNEREVGDALKSIMTNGVRREELWVTSKLWNDSHAKEDVVPACKKSLHDLGLDYLDLYLVHWPFPNHHPPGASGEERAPNAVPYIHENYMTTWREMEQLVEKGLVRHIGTSNMTVPKLELVLRDAHIKPAVNQMELHPHFQQPELFDYVRSQGIVPVGFCPLGSPQRPERDRSPDDTSPLEDPVIQRIAESHGLHPATVCIKWAIQHGHVAIPFSTKRSHYRANLEAAVTEPLSDNEMEQISKIDQNCRFIKGQVFLWKAGQDWTDLWDVNGYIPQ